MSRLTLPRECHAGLRGPDVRIYSRVMRQLGIRLRDETDFFGWHLVGNIEHFQRDHKMAVTGHVHQVTFDALRPHFTPHEREVLLRADVRYAPHPRDYIVGACLGMLHDAPFPYREVRPIPDTIGDVEREGSDCSGTSITAYHYSHLRFGSVPDPSGNDFDHYGSTIVYMARGGRRVTVPQPGDCVFYYPAYSHVGIYLGNGRVFSHGKPGDPTVIPSSWATMIRSYL